MVQHHQVRRLSGLPGDGVADLGHRGARRILVLVFFCDDLLLRYDLAVVHVPDLEQSGPLQKLPRAFLIVIHKEAGVHEHADVLEQQERVRQAN